MSGNLALSSKISLHYNSGNVRLAQFIIKYLIFSCFSGVTLSGTLINYINKYFKQCHRAATYETSCVDKSDKKIKI